MLQKLPKTTGDSITLGSIVALGICPATDNKSFTHFASFDVAGELVSYELPDYSYMDDFIDLIKEIPFDDATVPTGERYDLQFIKTFNGFEIKDSTGKVITTHS